MAQAHQNKKTGKWRIQIYIGRSSENKPMYKTFSGDTKREAERAAKEFEFAQRQQQEKAEKGITLGEAVRGYIADRSNILSPSTIRGYEEVLRNNIPQSLLDTPISEITQQQIQVWVNELAADNRAPKTIRNAHGLVTATLKYNNTDLRLNTRLPQKSKRDIYVPEVDEIKNILSLSEGTKMYIPILLAALCGLRASEVSGLEEKHIFPDHIHITQARVACKGGTALKAPKSNAGYRDIPIPPEMYELIKANINRSGRVTNMASTSISKFWGEFRTKHGLPKDMNYHALRHHYASKCLLLGMPQKYIAELMGHSSTAMIERVYQHIFPSAMESYAKKLRADTALLLFDTAQIQNKGD